MKTYPRLLATAVFVAYCICAAGQSATQTGDNVIFTFTDFVTRVPVHLPLKTAQGNVGPNFICHQDLSGTPQSEPLISAYNDFRDLKGSLVNRIYGKSADDLSKLLDDVKKASDRNARMLLLFGIDVSSAGLGYAPPTQYTYRLSSADARLLEMGQEVSTLHTVQAGDATSAGGYATSGLDRNRCYKTTQIDKAIDEGVRVVTEIIRALSSPKFSSQNKPPA